MAIIQSYPITYDIKASDLLIGVTNISSTERPEYKTTSFRIGDIVASASTIASSYGQLSRMTSSPVVFNTLNVWQPIGVVATLNSLNSGMSIGATDKFALKNTSGVTKVFSINAHLLMNLTYASIYPFIKICFAVNGTIISDSIIDIGYDGNISNSAMFDNNWLVQLNNNDEVSVYAKVEGAIPNSCTLVQGKLAATQA